ncbi:MAG: hypothetical protein PHX61_12295 [Alphaproteobacteria bacterium]|nr:hypothetical protein [Alphaproteobacteria bacterium]
MQLDSTEEQKPVVSIIASSKKIVEGQQVEITAILSKSSKTDTSIGWSIVQADNGTAATTQELAEVSGVLVIPAGELQKIFYVTSLPASLAADEKSFRLEIAGANISNKVEYPFKVVKNVGTAAVSITSVLNDGVVNKTNRSAFTVSGVCSQSGSDVSIAVGAVNQTVPCSATMSWEATLDLTSVAEGAQALVVIHGTGDTPASANRALTKDTIDPTVAVTSPDLTTQVSAGNATSFSLSGTCSENGRNVTLSAVSDSGAGEATGTAVCSSGAWSAILNLEFLANGQVTVTASHADAVGNSITGARAYTKDAAVPVFTMTTPLANHVYNSSNYTTASVSGACSKTGASITLSGAVTGTTTCDGTTWSVTGLTVTGADGNKTISASIVDNAGNASSISVAVKKYTAKPTAALINAPSGINNFTDISAIVQVPLAVSGKYKYKIGDKASTNCSVAAGYSAEFAAALTLTDSSGTDGEKRLCVVAIDDYGNQQDYANATLAEWTKKTSLPVVAITSSTHATYINNNTKAAFTVSGTCSEAGRNVTLQGSIPVISVVCAGDNTWSKVLNLSAIADGSIVVLATHSDVAGNVGQSLNVYTKDTVVPSITLDTATTTWINRTNRAAFAVTGTCSEYSDTDNIAIAGGDSTLNVKCAGAAGWTASASFTGAGNGNVTGVSTATRDLTVTITDVAGNTAQVTKTYNIKTTEPTVTITTPVAAGYVNDATKAAVAVLGTCSDNGTGNILLKATKDATTVTKAIDCASLSFDTGVSNKLNLTTLAEGSFSLEAKITDLAGNEKSTSISVNKKTTYPQIGISYPISGICVSETNKNTFTVRGTCSMEAGASQVSVKSAKFATQNLTCTGGAFSTTVNFDTTGLVDSDLFQVDIEQTDVAGNKTLQSASLKYFNSAPTIAFGGWEDVYAVGPKTYLDGNAAEPGVVSLKWKAWPALGNTCQPEAVKVFRSATSGSSLAGGATEVTAVSFATGVPADVRAVSDTTLHGTTAAQAATATDFAKAWYYGLKAVIAGNTYDITAPTQYAEIRVVAPASNQALVHRWIANQETCGLMGKNSDPLNNYRCDFNGTGKVVVGGNNYHDIMHDMIVDRFELGCNISSTCGPAGNQLCISGNFADRNNPNDAGGVDGAVGSVYYSNSGTAGNYCAVKTTALGTTSGWVVASAANASQLALMATNKAHAMPLVYIQQAQSDLACKNLPTVEYNQMTAYAGNTAYVANKVTRTERLLTQKEWRAAAAWRDDWNYNPAIYTNPDDWLHYLEAGSAKAAESNVGKCNSSSKSGAPTPAARSFLFGFDSITSSLRPYETGSKVGTSLCQSRYGVQDMVGNVWEWTADRINCPNTVGNTCEGLDYTFQDVAYGINNDMTGFKFDGIQGPGDTRSVGGTSWADDWLFQDKTNSTNYMNLVLGIPMVGNDNGSGVLISNFLASSSNRLHGDRFWLTPGNGNTLRGLIVGGAWNYGTSSGRWASYWSNAVGSTSYNLGARCGFPLQ